MNEELKTSTSTTWYRKFVNIGTAEKPQWVFVPDVDAEQCWLKEKKRTKHEHCR